MPTIDITTNCCDCGVGGSSGTGGCCFDTGDSCVQITGSNSLFSFPGGTVHLSPVISGPGIISNLRSGIVFTPIKYTDPTTGLVVCVDLSFAISAYCLGSTNNLQYNVFTPTLSNWDPSLFLTGSGCVSYTLPGVSLRGVTGSTDYEILPGNVWSRIYTNPFPSCGGALDSWNVNFGLPPIPSLGVPGQTFALTLTPTPKCGDNPKFGSDSILNMPVDGYPDSHNPCCSGGPGPFNDTDEAGPGGNILSRCCSVGGVEIKRLLNIAIANTSCGPCADGILGGLVYVDSMKAWTGNFIVCGSFLTVYFYCVPPSIFGLAFYFGGVLGTVQGTPTGNNCNPLDLTYDVAFPVAPPPGGAISCHLAVRVFES